MSHPLLQEDILKPPNWARAPPKGSSRPLCWAGWNRLGPRGSQSLDLQCGFIGTADSQILLRLGTCIFNKHLPHLPTACPFGPAQSSWPSD